MIEKRANNRDQLQEPVTFCCSNLEIEGELINFSGSGALVRVAHHVPLGPEILGQEVRFIHWSYTGLLLRPLAKVTRFFEDADGKNLAVKFYDNENK